MNFIGTLIDYGLNDPGLLRCSLTKLVRNHRRRNVTKEDVGVSSRRRAAFFVCPFFSHFLTPFRPQKQAVGGVIMRYTLDALDAHRSPTLEEAFEAFLGTVAEAFE